VFTAEVLCGGIALPVVLPALASCAIATATAWVALPREATYPGLPDLPPTTSATVWALAVAVPLGLLAVGFVRLIARVSHHRPTGWWSLPAPLVAMLVVGLVGIPLPELFGNGKILADLAFDARGSIVLLLVLGALKPLLTSLCLGSGIAGGLFTPTLSTGAALGAGLGGLWSLAWPGTGVVTFAVIGAAAFVGAAMQAPLAALALLLELTHAGFGLMVPMAVATVLATVTARVVDGYSIYSGRLPPSGP
jgi:chloride channel protein, CIC family